MQSEKFQKLFLESGIVLLMHVHGQRSGIDVAMHEVQRHFPKALQDPAFKAMIQIT